MRLSEIRGERVFDVIADIMEPCCNIAGDPAVSKLFGGERPEGMEPREWALYRAKTAVPSLMRDHRADLVAVLATLEGVTEDEYMEALTLPDLLRGVYEMLTDEDLLSFLSSQDKSPEGDPGEQAGLS